MASTAVVIELAPPLEALLQVLLRPPTTPTAAGKRGTALASIDEGLLRGIFAAAVPVLLSDATLLTLRPPLTIMATIRGRYDAFLDVLNRCGPPPATTYLLLGDLTCRGHQSIECMTLALLLKMKYPVNFYIARGRYDCAALGRIYGFYDECKQRYNVKLWKEASQALNCLPLAAIIGGKLFCASGGLSPELQSLDQISMIQRPYDVTDRGLVCDLLWACPERDADGWIEADKGVSYSFGPNIVRKFLDTFGFERLIVGGQVLEEGHEELFDGATGLWTVQNYCGEFNNAGAVMHIDAACRCTFTVLPPRGPLQSSKK